MAGASFTPSGPDPAWERRHPHEPEAWSFDFWAPDGSLAGFVGLTFHTAPRVAWYWAALVGHDRPYLLVRDLELDLPRRPAAREVRGDGLWADVNCETPHDHWSLGLEAFGVALDDPDEALGAERGDRTGLGLDLEWEAAGPVSGAAGDYDQPCVVHGEVLVGLGARVEKLAVDGHGWRRHARGGQVWTAPQSRFVCRLEDGTSWRGENPPGAVEVLRRAPLRLELGAGRAVLERALVRVTLADGRRGLGWAEEVYGGDLLLGEPNSTM